MKFKDSFARDTTVGVSAYSGTFMAAAFPNWGQKNKTKADNKKTPLLYTMTVHTCLLGLIFAFCTIFVFGTFNLVGFNRTNRVW